MLPWVVGIAAVVAVLWAGYHFLSRDQEVRDGADQAADTAAQVGDAAKNLMVGDVDVGQTDHGRVHERDHDAQWRH